MTDRWQVQTDDPAERAAFAAPGAWLGLPCEPAGPPNRLRSVARIRADEADYFVKTFEGVQWHNRLRFALTAPRARHDAEREFRVTCELRAAGHAAPRPIAWGERDGTAYYVCARLPGTSFADLLRRGAVTPPLARAVAEHCARLLWDGFHLPDLSADHVFVDGARFGVLDLHNGTLARRGSVPHRVGRRVLRRFAKSVRELDVPWPAALRFAVRLLRGCGLAAAARRILRTLPPLTTSARYERGGKAAAYASRNPARHAREMRLLDAVFPGRAGETVLDLPCGAGRLAPWLADRGCRYVAADGAFAMLKQADLPRAVQADALAWPFADRCVDGAVVFRFLHHLPDDRSDRAIAEACRVARRFVVVSFFHPCSAHHLARRLGGGSTRFARPLGALRRTFAANGFELIRRAADLPFAKDLWLASFERREAPHERGRP
jgi:SAM-dependent methyltransferase